MTNNLQLDLADELWTYNEIESRLGSSTILFPRHRLLEEKDLEKIREADISRIEVCGLGNPGHLGANDQKYLSWMRLECEKQDISVVSTHCPGYLFNSDNEDLKGIGPVAIDTTTPRNSWKEDWQSFELDRRKSAAWTSKETS